MTIAIVGAGGGPDNQRGHGDALPVNAEAVVTTSCALWRQPWVYIVDAQVDQGRPVLRKKEEKTFIFHIIYRFRRSPMLAHWDNL